MAFRDPVIIGERLTLDFSQVNIDEFELKRRDFHSSLQGEFFSNFRIQDVETYQVRRGDNIGAIARTRYSTPIWLLRAVQPAAGFQSHPDWPGDRLPATGAGGLAPFIYYTVPRFPARLL